MMIAALRFSTSLMQMSTEVMVTISDRLYVEGLGAREVGLLRQAASVANPFYERSVKERTFSQPKTIELMGYHHGVVSVPRGMAGDVCRGLDALGIEWEINDLRIAPKANFRDARCVTTLRDYQEDAVKKLYCAMQGIYVAPTGSGKTMVAIELIRRLGLQTLILVDRLNLVEQWAKRIESFLGVSVYREGMGSKGSHQAMFPVSVMTVQSLSRRASPAEGVYPPGLVILDECHHVTAEMYNFSVDAFPALYRIGLSATPERHEGLLRVAEAYLGAVAAETEASQLRRAGVILSPSVVRLSTDFEFDYVPSGKNASGKWERNNWTKLISCLVGDRRRNVFIAKTVSGMPCRKHLVVSRNKRQLSLIRDELELGSDMKVFMLTGDESRSEREGVILYVDTAPPQETVVVLSTIADEALDCPALDCIHIVYPTANPALLKQQIGRVVRTSPQKMGASVVDYCDAKVPILLGQAHKRRMSVYTPEGMDFTWEDER